MKNLLNLTKKYENKQKEFNMMMKKEQPKQPEFSDESKDEPLTNENLDKLLQEQMKQREYLVKSNFDLSGNPEPVLNINEQNTIVAIKPEPENNLIQQQPQQSMSNFTPLSPIPETEDKTNIT